MPWICSLFFLGDFLLRQRAQNTSNKTVQNTCQKAAVILCPNSLLIFPKNLQRPFWEKQQHFCQAYLLWFLQAWKLGSKNAWEGFIILSHKRADNWSEKFSKKCSKFCTWFLLEKMRSKFVIHFQSNFNIWNSGLKLEGFFFGFENPSRKIRP